MVHGPAHGFLSLQDELLRLRLNGRATDAQFAQNPLPVARAMGRALGVLHTTPAPEALEPMTDLEVSHAVSIAESGRPFPEPFSRVKSETLVATLSNRPTGLELVPTHGSPIVRAAVLADSVVTFDDAGTQGLDPAERDLSIAFRSVSETFTSEVAATLLEGYIEAGGSLPDGPALDWYGVLAAFR